MGRGVDHPHAPVGHRLLRIVLEPFDVDNKAADGRPDNLLTRQIGSEERKGVAISHPQELDLELIVGKQKLAPSLRGDQDGVVRNVKDPPRRRAKSVHWRYIYHAERS